jgi:5-methylcytosine-specific restriction endonuclease McrA
MTGGKSHGWDSSGRKDRLRQAGTSGWDEGAAAKRIMAMHAGICHVCGQSGADQVDHVIPLCEGGLDEDTNKAPIHSTPCHVQKTAAEAGRARGRKYSRKRGVERHPGMIDPGDPR